MANPSLQIGNGKFAIKENDLLGYSSSGTRFFPIPITMTRATSGTRVNPSGLIEDVELLGSEEVTDGNFPSGTTAWTFGAGWSIGTNKAERLVAASSTDLVQASVFPNLTSTFKISFDVVRSAGSVRLRAGTLNLPYVNATDTYIYYVTPVSNDQLKFQADSSFIGSITNISVKEATIDGLARVDYTDGTGSLLVEPQRTNLITYSEDFSQSVWAKENGGTGDSPVVTSNIGISPDGTQNADKIVFDLNGGTSSSDLSQLRFSLSSLSGDYTNSIYLKSFDGASYNVSILDANGTVNTATITNEWQRFEYYNGGGTTSANPFRIRLRGNETTSDNAALLIYGAQLEAGSYATSYIKTQGSTVTRNQDEYTKTGISNLINSEEGVLFVEMAALADDSTNRSFTISDGTNDNRLVLKYDNQSNVIESFNRVSGTQTAFLSSTVTDITVFNKIAIKYKLNDYALWINGVEVATDSSATTFIGLNTLTSSSGGSSFFGKVKQLQIFKTALSDSELATLTTI